MTVANLQNGRQHALADESPPMELTPLFTPDSVYEELLQASIKDLPIHTRGDDATAAGDETSRLARALDLVRCGCLRPMEDGKRWRVTGKTGVYIVRSSGCSCPQGRHKNWCYHRVGLYLYTAWCDRLVNAHVAMPTPAPAHSAGFVRSLDELVTRATLSLPDCVSELLAGRALVIAGGVMLIDDLHASVWVLRETPDESVTVTHECPVPSCKLVPSGWCRHRFAHVMFRRLVKAMQESEAAPAEDVPEPEPPEPDDAPLPEAPDLNELRDDEAYDNAPVPESVVDAAYADEEERDAADIPAPPVNHYAPEEEPPVVTNGTPPVGEDAPAPPEITPSRRPFILRPLAPRSIVAIIADLSRPLPRECVAVRRQKGVDIPYLHHSTVLDILDTYAPNWQGTVVKMELLGTRCAVTYRLSIPCAEGMISREDVGLENDWDEDEGARYGDPGVNAKATALKRAAMQFGLGRWLYEHDHTHPALVTHLKRERAMLFEALGQAVDAAGLERAAVLAWVRHHTGALRNDDVSMTALQDVLMQLRGNPA